MFNRTSSWTVGETGVWDGEVKVVPSLAAPGFCNIMSQVKTYWPNAAGTTHIFVRARSTIPYKGLRFSFGADTLFLQFKCFKANFDMAATGDWEDIAIPFDQFSNNWSSYTGEVRVARNGGREGV